MAVKRKEEQGLVKFYVPMLVFLLLVATFFVGRLSAQLEMMKEGVGVGEVGKAGETQKQQGQKGETGIGVENLKKIAADLKLKKKDFGKCLDDGKYEQKVKDDLAYGASLGVSGTPTFFINGIMLVGSQPIQEFEKIIDAEIKDGSGDKVLGASNDKAGAVRKKVKMGVGPVKGNKDAVVKIVEFSDFECPFCKKTLPTIDALFEKYGDKISLEYRHFPLGFHANAQKAAEASECAREQGKFWQMHDAIFEAQG